MIKIKLGSAYKLFGVETTRAIESKLNPRLPAHTLMQKAGQATASLALAMAPHSRLFWIAFGPGNNGGDGLEAAVHLKSMGKNPLLTWLGTPDTAPEDARLSYQRACQAGIPLSPTPPETFDFCIDALLGIGASRPAQGAMAESIHLINSSSAPVLSVDIPSGLHADTGSQIGACVNADCTLSLLTLKPGLFTACGRDASGQVWFDPLIPQDTDRVISPMAILSGATAMTARLHASHKGSLGDVAVIGGATGMAGAALLAATAALNYGAGRVYLGMLDEQSAAFDTHHPELMLRPIDSLFDPAQTVVCGCGGALAIASFLPRIFFTFSKAVIDADALNCVANDQLLQNLVAAREKSGQATVLTPHPLEAARLLHTTVQSIQNNRLEAAIELSQRFLCTVILKGSGTVIASPNQTCHINPSGNPRLATAGTGDVLAGMVGARLANGESPFQAAIQSVFHHGSVADNWPADKVFTASALAAHL
jgi:ADP-dependent NAD(P)H-hydrate dehydratase / NAD(P)H-hydrate epimerase